MIKDLEGKGKGDRRYWKRDREPESSHASDLHDWKKPALITHVGVQNNPLGLRGNDILGFGFLLFLLSTTICRKHEHLAMYTG